MRGRGEPSQLQGSRRGGAEAPTAAPLSRAEGGGGEEEVSGLRAGERGGQGFPPCKVVRGSMAQGEEGP